MEGVSLLAEAGYGLSSSWSLKGAFAMDAGKLRGDNYGFQLSVIKTGLFKN